MKNKIPFYKDPAWIIPIVIGIILTFFGGNYAYNYVYKNVMIGENNTQTNFENSTLSQSQICPAGNCQQTIYNNYYGWENISNNPTRNEVCSEAWKLDCFNPKFVEKTKNETCVSNPTYVDGIIGRSILIDNCDVVFVKPEQVDMKSGTVYLLVEFENITSQENRFLFDAASEYNKNRVSLYLQPDGFLTLSLFDKDFTSIELREKLTESDLENWMQIGITWEESSGNVSLYINDKLRKTRSIDKIDFDSTFKGIFIGSNAAGKNQAFAIMDEVRIASIPENVSYFESTYFNLIGKPGYGNLGPEETLNNALNAD